MPLSLLIAIFLAFGTDGAAEPGPFSAAELRTRIAITLGIILAIGLVAALIGEGVAFARARRGAVSRPLRRGFWLGSRLVELGTLVGFGGIILGLGWRAVVETGLGLRGFILIDEFLILLPFLLAQLVGWWGLYAGERAVRADRIWVRPIAPRGRFVVLKARQTLGLVLPVAVLYSLGQDLLRRGWPEGADEPVVQLAWMTVLGALVLVFAPAFVRLTWPTRPLPPGPLRDRLEQLAQRFRFRYTEILVWDTGHALVNALVTGALPWFRYVLLTDALVEHLEPLQVEAVFGHEVGHIAHRHLFYFGFFLLGSIGVMAIVTTAISSLFSAGLPGAVAVLVPGLDQPTMLGVVQSALELLSLGLYFLVVFGYLSRRFERQADVFGCRAVSCGRGDCPPHADLNAGPGLAPASVALCPVGIRVFVNALADTALLNGVAKRSWWSWRHGSIARRIAFLESLEGRPEAERRFQTGVRRLRLGLALALASALLVAWRSGSLEALR